MNKTDVVRWLSEHEMQLFADSVKITEARKMCEKDLNRKVSAGEFKAGREFCGFWKVLSSRQFSRKHLLTWQQWDKYRQWCLNNTRTLSIAPSIKFVARVMRAEGIIVSPELLESSCTFMGFWNGRKKDGEA